MGIKRQGEEKKLYISLNKKLKEYKKLDVEIDTFKTLKDLEFDLIWENNDELLFFHKAGFLILHGKKNNDGFIHYISLRDSELSKPPGQIKQNYIDFNANCFGIGRLDYGGWFTEILSALKNIMFVTNIMEECPDESGFDLLCDVLLVEDAETVMDVLYNAPNAFYEFLNIDELTNIQDKNNKDICRPLLINYHVDYKDSFENEFTKINNFNSNEARWRLSLRDELKFRENNPEIFCKKNISISKKKKL